MHIRDLDIKAYYYVLLLSFPWMLWTFNPTISNWRFILLMFDRHGQSSGREKVNVLIRAREDQAETTAKVFAILITFTSAILLAESAIISSSNDNEKVLAKFSPRWRKRHQSQFVQGEQFGDQSARVEEGLYVAARVFHAARRRA